MARRTAATAAAGNIISWGWRVGGQLYRKLRLTTRAMVPSRVRKTKDSAVRWFLRLEWKREKVRKMPGRQMAK